MREERVLGMGHLVDAKAYQEIAHLLPAWVGHLRPSKRAAMGKVVRSASGIAHRVRAIGWRAAVQKLALQRSAAPRTGLPRANREVPAQASARAHCPEQ